MCGHGLSDELDPFNLGHSDLEEPSSRLGVDEHGQVVEIDTRIGLRQAWTMASSGIRFVRVDATITGSTGINVP